MTANGWLNPVSHRPDTVTMADRVARKPVLCLCAAATVGIAACAAADPAAGPPAIGRPAGPAEIAAWDTDVGPDGEGLPDGSGTAADGAAIYARRCAGCHGETGQKGRDWLAGGPDAPRKTIGNYWPYATTLFDYIRRAMPPAAPGSLSDDQVYALTARLLVMNGIIDAGTPVNRQTLPAIEMPARERFVTDPRPAGGAGR